MENIPSTSNHESLKGIFSKFGVVEYVSLPKFKSTGDIKGFAFVEFAEVVEFIVLVEPGGSKSPNSSKSANPWNS